jgi:hypothetical protein
MQVDAPAAGTSAGEGAGGCRAKAYALIARRPNGCSFQEKS